MEIAAILLDLETRLLDPVVRRSGQAASLLHDDFIEFGSSGRVLTRNDVLALLAAEEPSRCEIDDYRCTVLAPDVALVTYGLRTVNDDGSVTESLRSSVWQQSAGSWQIRFHQATPSAGRDES